ncbi:MAG: aldo/keto reductase [Halobacterium sp.]
MNTRRLGSTGYEVSEVSLGTWEIGGEWGDVPAEDGKDAVRAALDAGVNFLDTADVYGDGRSERLISDVLDEREEDPIVATKAGRRLDPHEAERYNHENLERFVDRSRENLGVDSLDLLQLHCPPTATYYRPETFDALAALQSAGKIDHYGVSVEKVEEGMKAIEYPGVDTVQIIFNPFRQRPAERFLDAAASEDVGVIVRVPLASGLLTGAIDANTEFPENDHRNFNRDGDAFDVGETFAGVPLDVGAAAVDELEEYVRDDLTLPQFALRWILDFNAVSTVIPGSTTPEHIRSNVAASNARPLEHRVHGAVRDVYEKYVFEHVHHRW